MILVNDVQESLGLFEALASPVRLQIIGLLRDGREMNINEIAKQIHLTNSALTMHIQKLADCGILRIRLCALSRGTQKLCSLTEDKILIEFVDKIRNDNFYETELEVGQYSDYSISPTCGIADLYSLIGDFDNPQVFSYPERFQARILWFTEGFVTYRFPSKLRSYQQPEELQFSMEISGEAPGASQHFPSSIHFIVNGIDVGEYVCPGEYFDRRGRFTPDWWSSNFGQYGRLKNLSIDRYGTLLDGLRIGDTTIEDLHLDKNENISLTIDCQDKDNYHGGVNLFGTGFGDYNQGIRCRLFYSETKEKTKTANVTPATDFENKTEK